MSVPVVCAPFQIIIIIIFAEIWEKHRLISIDDNELNGQRLAHITQVYCVRGTHVTHTHTQRSRRMKIVSVCICVSLLHAYATAHSVQCTQHRHSIHSLLLFRFMYPIKSDEITYLHSPSARDARLCCAVIELPPSYYVCAMPNVNAK